MKKFKSFLILQIFFAIFVFSACKNSKSYDLTNSNYRIDVSKNMTWAFATAESLPEETDNLSFSHLQKWGSRNLVLSEDKYSDKNYVWIKINFTIPEELKNRDLGLFISYLHFADKVWINGTFAGEYGRFPPKELSSQFIAHFYPFPKEVLNQDEQNTVLIKVYCLGRAEISKNAFIGTYEDAKLMERKYTFNLTTFYMLFEGGMFASFLIYFLMFLIEKRRHKEYLSFSLACFFTLQFALMFFAPITNLYFNLKINFLFFYKYFMCFCFYSGAYFLSVFMMQYMGVVIPKWRQILRSVNFLGLSIATFIMPSYVDLMRSAVILMNCCLGALFFNIGYVFLSLFNKQRRDKAAILCLGLLPLIIGALIDVIVHYVIKKTDAPFYMYVGWQCSIISYLVVLCIRFTRTSVENMYLNRSLKEEVESQTNQMKITSRKLEKELNRARADIQMASIVQQKTFEHSARNFIGWDIGVSYLPLSEVSGDMYDFYNIGYNLNGVSLFDVSGHGIAASLITMLSKNIISQAFKENQMENRSSAELLLRINDEITRSKGDAENYLTGLIFQFDAFNGDKCDVELANAGHPHPFLYSEKENEAISLISGDTQKQYGAIGIRDMDVSFQNIYFAMHSGDVLVCFTDGITEIKNSLRNQFGREALKQIIEENHDLPAQKLVDKIVSEIMAFAGKTPREDDVTILVLKRENPDDFLEEL